ncbi:hypothetical protein [Hyalangium sp.]|uniref:hypothetical protein n=1 Tax=Hyalangium sp. TaxID=2028555 RepID=UPI002D28930D|nr:hypothetical protein [Hyalangium sp.]HYI02899.1 hypothetical protein [Hyalangium sp.]
MRVRRGWRALSWVLVAQLLMNGCATVPQGGTGGSGSPVEQRGPTPGSSQWEELEEARRAELESALAGMWGVASEVREVGAVLEFSYWAEGGAFSLLSLRRPEWGRGLGSVLEQESFASGLRESLPPYAEGAAGLLRLVLRREEHRWRADFHLDTGAEFPLEAKTWPIQQVGVRVEVLERLAATGREVASRVWAPEGAQVRWQVEVELEDERVGGLETRPPRSLPGGKSVRAAPETVGTWVNVLAPFTQGMGPRKVRLEWEGEHIAGSGLSRWKIVAAEVVRPPPPAPQNAEVALEYRAMHEQIQRQWREQTREGFQTMGILGAEQVALFVVAGWATRGLAVVVKAATPVIARMLTKGGTYAVGWFRSLFVRASPAEKQAFARLMAKAETQGLEALTIGERNEVRAFLTRLDGLASAKLSSGAKDELRRLAREDFLKIHPDLVKRLKELLKGPVDVHHRIPLDFAHFFPARDINAMDNLVAVEPRVHRLINRVWGEYTQRAGARATATEVEAVEKIVKKHFERWYSNTRDVPASEEMLVRSAQKALAELESLFAGVGR